MSDAPLIVINPTAGGGRALKLAGWNRERVEQRPDVEVRVTSRRGEAEELAAAAIADGRRRVVAVGGDGTVQEVLNGLMANVGGGELGVVPVGTGNDLARSLGLPSEPAEAWTVAMGEATRPLDVARATNGEGEDRWFASAGGIGFDAQVAAAMASRKGWQAGRAGYLLTTLTELRRFENRRVRIAIDDEVLERSVLFVAVANGEYYGGGMRIAPGARTDDGRLDVCVVGDISRLTAIRQMPNLYRGTHVAHSAVSTHAGTTVSIEGDAATRAHSTASRSERFRSASSSYPAPFASPCASLATMTTPAPEPIRVGARVHGAGGRRIGRVDAVFADYLLVRTAGLLPVDLYVPRPEIAVAGDRLNVEASSREAYDRWHRPLKRSPHDEA